MSCFEHINKSCHSKLYFAYSHCEKLCSFQECTTVSSGIFLLTLCPMQTKPPDFSGILSILFHFRKAARFIVHSKCKKTSTCCFRWQILLSGRLSHHKLCLPQDTRRMPPVIVRAVLFPLLQTTDLRNKSHLHKSSGQ